MEPAILLAGYNDMTGNPGIRPILDQVLVKQDPPNDLLESGLYMPQGQRDSWRDIGTVVAVGPGKYENGTRRELDVKPGDRVLFKRRPASALNGDGLEGGREEWKDMIVLLEEDIIGVIEEEE